MFSMVVLVIVTWLRKFQRMHCIHIIFWIHRLRDETAVCKIIEDLEKYLRLQGQVTDEELCRVYLKRIQHIYYKVCVELSDLVNNKAINAKARAPKSWTLEAKEKAETFDINSNHAFSKGCSNSLGLNH